MIMVRIGCAILGFALLVLWITGLNQLATPWLTWLVGLTSMASLAVAALLPPPPEGARAASGAPAAVGFALLVLWLIGVLAGATRWLTWWSLAFSCVFLGLAVAAAFEQRPHLTHRHA